MAAGSPCRCGGSLRLELTRVGYGDAHQTFPVGVRPVQVPLRLGQTQAGAEATAAAAAAVVRAPVGPRAGRAARAVDGGCGRPAAAARWPRRGPARAGSGRPTPRHAAGPVAE